MNPDTTLIGHHNPGKRETLWWKVSTLWRAAIDLSPQVLPLSDFDNVLNQSSNDWFDGKSPTLRRLAEELKRINDADLSYPIILAADGGVFDGKHRIMKAYSLGHKTIQAVKFPVNPEPDKKEIGVSR